MNNIFPNYIQGETIGALVIESMNEEQRALMRGVSKGWQNLSNRCTENCEKKALKVVDIYVRIFSETLKDAFVQKVDSSILLKYMQRWGQIYRPILLKSFKNFPQTNLDRYIDDPEKSILEKGEAVMQKNAEKITHKGADILREILLGAEIQTTVTSAPQSVAGFVALREIEEHTSSLITGTIYRLAIAKILFVWNTAAVSDMDKVLKKNETRDCLQSQLMTLFAKEIEDEYAASFTKSELARLHYFRNSQIHQNIHKIIKRPLQFQALYWITSNGF
jgi:hypothetical protein